MSHVWYHLPSDEEDNALLAKSVAADNNNNNNSAVSKAAVPFDGSDFADQWEAQRKLWAKNRSGNNLGRREADWVDKFNMGGNILGGLGDLASGWAALQNVGIARKSQAFKEDAWRQNMARQKTTVNNPIRMQQSMLKSDFYNDPARANALKLVT